MKVRFLMLSEERDIEVREGEGVELPRDIDWDFGGPLILSNELAVNEERLVSLARQIALLLP